MIIGCVGIVLIKTRSRLSAVWLARLMRLLFSKFIFYLLKSTNNSRDLLLHRVHRNVGGIVPPNVPPGGEGQRHRKGDGTDMLHGGKVESGPPVNDPKVYKVYIDPSPTPQLSKPTILKPSSPL